MIMMMAMMMMIIIKVIIITIIIITRDPLASVGIPPGRRKLISKQRAGGAL